MVENDTKIYKTLKNKSCLSIEKNTIKSEKRPYSNYKKLFSFRKSDLLSASFFNIVDTF